MQYDEYFQDAREYDDNANSYDDVFDTNRNHIAQVIDNLQFTVRSNSNTNYKLYFDDEHKYSHKPYIDSDCVSIKTDRGGSHTHTHNIRGCTTMKNSSSEIALIFIHFIIFHSIDFDYFHHLSNLSLCCVVCIVYT